MKSSKAHAELVPDRNFLFGILCGLVVAAFCSGVAALATAVTNVTLN